MYDLTMELDTEGEKSLYLQIYEYIRKEIREGKLLAQERLPSTRSLAEYLQVSRTTVDMAYQQLVSEGYLEARPYKGYFVCRVEELYQLEEMTPEYLPEMLPAPESGRTKEQKEKKTGKENVIDFSPMAIDMSCFPFGVWRRLNREILSYGNQDLFSAGEAKGEAVLRTTIQRYLHSSRGVNCKPGQIIIGAGTDYLLLLLEKLLGRIEVAMENPTYQRSYRMFHSFGYTVHLIDMDADGMMLQELQKTDASVLYLMPSHQYPTGSVMPIGRRMELLNWAREGKERYIIEDDYDSEFRYRGKPIPSLQASDRWGKVIYMGTFSKSIAPAIRVAYMVLPMPLLEKYEKDLFYYSSTVSRIDQLILNAFIAGGYFERYLNKMRKQYKLKHDLLLEELNPLLPYFTVSGEYAGLHLLLTMKEDEGFLPGKTMQEKEEGMIRQAKSRGLQLYGLAECCGKPGRVAHGPTLLIGYGGLSEKEIRVGAAKLRTCLMELIAERDSGKKKEGE